MTKATNYLVTVTDTKETLSVSYGQSTPVNSDRITISEDSGGFTFGTVGVTPTFCLADNSPVLTNPDGKCPVYQDLIPRTVLNGIVNTYFISATGGLGSPTIGCTTAEFSYLISIGAIAGATTGTTTLTGQVTSNVTLYGTGLRWIYYGNTPAVAGVDYNLIAYNGNPAPYAIGYIEVQLLKPIIPGTPYNLAFNAQYNTYAGTFNLAETLSGTDGCYGPFVNNQPNAITCTYATTTTTTTLVYRNVTISPQNSLAGSSYTVYINGTADTGWKSGTRSYVTGTIIRVDYTSPACGVLLNGVAYTSGTNTTISVGVASYTWTLYNADNWTNTGFTCIGNVYYTNQVNDCGGTRQIQTYPGSTCDCVCNENCNGTYYGPSVCGPPAEGYGNDLVQYQYYSCNNNPTGSFQVVEYCSCSCNAACDGFYQGTPYCSGNELRVNDYFSCNGAYAGYTVLDACSCSCNQGCQGTYWEYYCVAYGVSPYTQRRRQRYNCNGALTGVDEFVANCSGDCGADPNPVWQNDGGPYCGGAGGCTQFQGQNQVNPCNNQTYRTINLGVSSTCGSWNLEYYCVGTAQWSRERNTCTNETRNDTLIDACSPSCGGSPGTYYELYGCTGGYAWTQIPPDGIGQRYVLPYPVETFYTYSGSSNYFCTPPSGYNGSIQKTNDYYCP
jgi:hypothetical protein